MALTGCGSDTVPSLTGRVVDPPFSVDPGFLTTTDGDRFSLATSPTTPLTVVFFGYTSCADICPAVLSSLSSGLAKLPRERRNEITTVFVSTDPQRDTGAVLRRYLDRFDPDIVGLRGPLPATARIARSVGIYVDAGEEDLHGRHDPASHSTYVIAIDSTHQAPMFWDSNTAPSQFARDIRFLLEERPKHLRAPEVAPTTVGP